MDEEARILALSAEEAETEMHYVLSWGIEAPRLEATHG